MDSTAAKWASAALVLLVAALRCGPAGSDGARITVAAVGDIMMGTSFPTDVLPPGDGAGLFDPVAPLLRGADLVFGNLEGPLVDGGTPDKCSPGSREQKRCFEFRTPVRYGRLLKAAGFNVLNVANNHSSDFGPAGVESTLSALRDMDIQPVGGELIGVVRRAGRSVAVVGFSCSPPTRYAHSLLDLERARAVVAELDRAYDAVVVSFHGGAEGKNALHVRDEEEVFAGERRGNVVRFARGVIDAGADLVLGHGPHVARAMELYRGRLIAYSLGNFLTYGRFNTSGPNGLGLVLRAELASNGEFVSGRIVPVDLTASGIPVPDPAGGTVQLVRSLTGEDLGAQELSIGEDGALRLATRDDPQIR